jgi:coatomer protein complex subunit epsilon
VDEAKADINEAVQREGGDKDGDVLAVGVSLGIDGFKEYVRASARPRFYFTTKWPPFPVPSSLITCHLSRVESVFRLRDER